LAKEKKERKKKKSRKFPFNEEITPSLGVFFVVKNNSSNMTTIK